VVALYPDNVAGRLSVFQNMWISLYGGPTVEHKDEDVPSNDEGDERGNLDSNKERSPSPTGSTRGKLRTGLSIHLPSPNSAEDDVASIRSVKGKTQRKGGPRLIPIVIQLVSD
jgi:hypothetical protein